MIANERKFTEHEATRIEQLFESLANRCAQASVSEYLNLAKYNISRSPIKLKIALAKQYLPPFEFVHCLN
jgi:hypothetical protein